MMQRLSSIRVILLYEINNERLFFFLFIDIFFCSWKV